MPKKYSSAFKDPDESLEEAARRNSRTLREKSYTKEAVKGFGKTYGVLTAAEILGQAIEIARKK